MANIRVHQKVYKNKEEVYKKVHKKVYEKMLLLTKVYRIVFKK